MNQKRHRIWIALILLIAAPSFGQTSAPSAQPIPSRDELNALMKRVMDFQTRAYGDKAPTNWTAAAYWTGVMAAYKATNDEAYYNTARTWAEAANWKIFKRPFHADDIAVGQTYLELYMKDRQPRMIEDLRANLEPYFTRKSVMKKEVGSAKWEGDEAPWRGRNIWWWCDALYMGPPVMTRMTAATGDKRYVELMHNMYWDSIDFLLDREENLCYRDAANMPDKKKSPTGQKIFWARGNGWVYAGIIRTIDYLPKDDPQRQKYVDLFKQMTGAIVKCQGEDGLWRAAMTEPTWFPNPETSGSSFFCYGLLAGINRGYLDRETYLPIALRAWNGLSANVAPDGGVNFAQAEGSAPAPTSEETHRDYAQGAFLLAGSELYTMKLQDKGGH